MAFIPSHGMGNTDLAAIIAAAPTNPIATLAKSFGLKTSVQNDNQFFWNSTSATAGTGGRYGMCGRYGRYGREVWNVREVWEVRAGGMGCAGGMGGTGGRYGMCTALVLRAPPTYPMSTPQCHSSSSILRIVAQAISSSTRPSTAHINHFITGWRTR